jgi:hypothetical protein
MGSQQWVVNSGQWVVNSEQWTVGSEQWGVGRRTDANTERCEKTGKLWSNHIFFGLRLCVEQEFLVAFGAGDGGGDDFCDLPAEIGDGLCDSLDGKFVDFGIAHDAAFADVAATGFELRLDEDDSLGERGRSCKNRSEKECCGDKGDVHHEKGELGRAGFGECVGGEEACVGTFDETNARIVAELHCDLAEAGVDGGDVGGAVLEKTVSKAAGGCADVEAETAGDVDFPVDECGLKFETAAAYEGHVVAEQADGGIGRDGSAGFVDFLFVDEYSASENEGAGALAALDQASVNEEEIDAGFRCSGQISVCSVDQAAAHGWLSG